MVIRTIRARPQPCAPPLTWLQGHIAGQVAGVLGKVLDDVAEGALDGVSLLAVILVVGDVLPAPPNIVRMIEPTQHHHKQSK